MSAAVLLAAAAAGCGVFAAWDVLRVAELASLGGGPARFLAPWRLAGSSGLQPSAAERRRLAVVAAGVLGAGAWMLFGLALGVLSALLTPLLVARALRWRRERWRTRAADGASILARALADALTGGHSPRGALAEVAAAGGAGAAADQALRGVSRALAVGEPTVFVLERWRERMGSPPYDLLISAILLQRDAGGDLAGLLRDLAGDLEHARRATADACAATSQARFTAAIVCALPAAAAILTELTSPGSLAAMLSAPLPRVMAVAALLLDLVALSAVRRLSRVLT